MKTAVRESELVAGFEKNSLPCERETHISFDDETASQGYLRIDTFQRLVIKQLLTNRDFVVKDMNKEGSVVTYLSGILPLNSIRIKDKATGKNELNYILKH